MFDWKVNQNTATVVVVAMLRSKYRKSTERARPWSRRFYRKIRRPPSRTWTFRPAGTMPPPATTPTPRADSTGRGLLILPSGCCHSCWPIAGMIYRKTRPRRRLRAQGRIAVAGRKQHGQHGQRHQALQSWAGVHPIVPLGVSQGGTIPLHRRRLTCRACRGGTAAAGHTSGLPP